MNVILKAPGENAVEEEIIFSVDFFKEYFENKPTSATILPFLNIMVHYVDGEVKPNISLFGIYFFGKVLITGVCPNGAPCSLNNGDSAFIKRYLKSELTKPKVKGPTICEY